MFRKLESTLRRIELYKHPFMQYFFAGAVSITLALAAVGALEDLALVAGAAGFIGGGFGIVGTALHYATGTLEAETRYGHYIVVGVTVLFVVASIGATVVAMEPFADDDPDVEEMGDYNDVVTRTYEGPNVSATVVECSNQTCNVSVSASDWDYYQAVTVKSMRSNTTWTLTPDTPNRTVTVARTLGGSSDVPNEVIISLPVPKDASYSEWVRTEAGATTDGELTVVRYVDSTEDDCVLDGQGYYDPECGNETSSAQVASA